MHHWLRTAFQAVVVLVASAGLMALTKFAMGGSLESQCYTILIEFCRKECWVGRPFSSFPLACDRAADVMILVLANLGVFVASACMSTLVVMCCSRYCCSGPDNERNAEHYRKLYEEEDGDIGPSAPPRSIRLETLRSASGSPSGTLRQ